MSFKKLEDFIELAKKSGASALKFEDGDQKFSVNFSTAEVSPVNHIVAPIALAAPVKAEIQKVNDGLIEVTSPFVGTFYKSSSPEAAAFAKVGDRVSSGKVLCIVEAMKIMNEIESDVAGEIVEVCVDNEMYVEFGQVLFRIKP